MKLYNCDEDFILSKILSNIIFLNDRIIQLSIKFNNDNNSFILTEINQTKADVIINVSGLQFYLENNKLNDTHIESIINILSKYNNRLFEISAFLKNLKNYTNLNIHNIDLKYKIINFMNDYQKIYSDYENTNNQKLATTILICTIIAIGTLASGCSTEKPPIEIDENGPYKPIKDQNELLEEVMEDIKNQKNND
ncbi:MAG: hypothetical protein M0R46_04885 [Candidatus Muirbacterium halophilum]|nr:hypothetical protein [Candidatus Muirbacterium halophilum]MCK9475231.1 hypothetical protein [Candidatus Muirbacterium halophilum]